MTPGQNLVGRFLGSAQEQVGDSRAAASRATALLEAHNPRGVKVSERLCISGASALSVQPTYPCADPALPRAGENDSSAPVSRGAVMSRLVASGPIERVVTP